MPSIGPLEIAIVLIVALVIFGPRRLPELGRSAGNGFREFKSSISGVSDGGGERGTDRPEGHTEPEAAVVAPDRS